MTRPSTFDMDNLYQKKLKDEGSISKATMMVFEITLPVTADSTNFMWNRCIPGTMLETGGFSFKALGCGTVSPLFLLDFVLLFPPAGNMKRKSFVNKLPNNTIVYKHFMNYT